eukprot:TRINITY_DN3636_c0_g2_i1.p1 TRINITY_DN3636_c0_g2~~TRINITY_DN3636_c0_g2_i1.p1  ORF type:complete len:399 (+),score=108.43 TRINITY_DN3636_c0_g2_i1:1089-2285(+)
MSSSSSSSRGRASKKTTKQQQQHKQQQQQSEEQKGLQSPESTVESTGKESIDHQALSHLCTQLQKDNGRLRKHLSDVLTENTALSAALESEHLDYARSKRRLMLQVDKEKRAREEAEQQVNVLQDKLMHQHSEQTRERKAGYQEQRRLKKLLMDAKRMLGELTRNHKMNLDDGRMDQMDQIDIDQKKTGTRKKEEEPDWRKSFKAWEVLLSQEIVEDEQESQQTMHQTTNVSMDGDATAELSKYLDELNAKSKGKGKPQNEERKNVFLEAQVTAHSTLGFNGDRLNGSTASSSAKYIGKKWRSGLEKSELPELYAHLEQELERVRMKLDLKTEEMDMEFEQKCALLDERDRLKTENYKLKVRLHVVGESVYFSGTHKHLFPQGGPTFLFPLLSFREKK